MIPVYQWGSNSCEQFLQRISKRGSETPPEIEKSVAEIIRTVRQNGDAALLEYTRRFDGIELDRLRIEPAEIEALAAQADPELCRIIRQAKENIQRFHSRQLEQSWDFDAGDGVRLGQRILPLGAAGLYVPGGTAAYPSTVLMNAIPAQIAGVPRIAVTTPVHQLRKNPIIAAVLKELNLTEVYGIGGAQAVAALAYGTETIARVDKIVGPGNIFVATAKRQVFGVVDIDMIAGPSEVVVVADDTANPDYVAADMMAQAEHDANACAVAVVLSVDMAEKIQASLKRLVQRLARREIVQAALDQFGAIILAADLDQAARAVEAVAPEHLELMLASAESFARNVPSAGAIFFGPYSCESVGDYFAGPNHVLPTSGTARFASPLGVYDFLKRTSLIKYSRQALERNGALVEQFALAEKLDAHALSVRIRFEK